MEGVTLLGAVLSALGIVILVIIAGLFVAFLSSLKDDKNTKPVPGESAKDCCEEDGTCRKK
ncbi:MAG: hypothetical protein AAB527_03640 [Patescibacteria group bacterium]|mgnify:CR=1 FL=1